VIEGMQTTFYRRIVRVRPQRIVMQKRSGCPKADQRGRTVVTRSASRRGIGIVVSPLVDGFAGEWIKEAHLTYRREGLIGVRGEVVPHLTAHPVGGNGPPGIRPDQGYRYPNLCRQEIVLNERIQVLRSPPGERRDLLYILTVSVSLDEGGPVCEVHWERQV